LEAYDGVARQGLESRGCRDKAAAALYFLGQESIHAGSGESEPIRHHPSIPISDLICRNRVALSHTSILHSNISIHFFFPSMISLFIFFLATCLARYDSSHFFRSSSIVQSKHQHHIQVQAKQSGFSSLIRGSSHINQK
jgi:hypothetical protein